MPILIGQYFECKLWKRKVNSGQYDEVPTTFKAKIIGDQTMSRNQPLTGLLTRATNLVIETIDLETINIQDKIQILDSNYQVERVVTKKTNSPYTLGAHKKSNEHLLKKLPKVIYLV
jgi:hypothetical protein